MWWWGMCFIGRAVKQYITYNDVDFLSYKDDSKDQVMNDFNKKITMNMKCILEKWDIKLNKK
jgi:hypothetical protein